MFGMSPPLHPSTLQDIGGPQRSSMSYYQLPLPHTTTYGGIGFGLGAAQTPSSHPGTQMIGDSVAGRALPSAYSSSPPLGGMGRGSMEMISGMGGGFMRGFGASSGLV
ncbi:hypothetical protein IAR55_004566 [Kwoniella newhampshirensis]|uniref:Uncharacterized protein n=1 Tax=Kwoniella newhampshirensis TaxID=1651941 RepID=A0AAW0YXZ9_9TREE